MTEAKHLSDLQIQGLLDDALEAGLAREARVHLAACRDCARRLEAHARLFAAIEAWGDSPPPRDLAPSIVHRLAQPRLPFGLRVATAVQAALAAVILVLAWPLVGGLLSSLALTTIPAFEFGFSETLAAQAEGLIVSAEAALQQISVSADAWLRLAPQWMTLWPAIVGGALLVAVLGNSILLAGDAAGRRGVLPRRI
jgi:anti-sigma factor RsiW